MLDNFFLLFEKISLKIGSAFRRSPRFAPGLGVMRIILEFTFGTGVKQVRGTFLIPLMTYLSCAFTLILE